MEKNKYIVVQVKIVSPHGGGYHDPYIGYDSADVARIEAWYKAHIPAEFVPGFRLTHIAGSYNFKMSFVCAHEYAPTIADPNPGAMIAIEDKMPGVELFVRGKIIKFGTLR